MEFNFTVRGDRLVADSDYGFVEGNQSVYRAKFKLDDSWNEYHVMCAVYSNDNKLVPVPVSGGECLLPKFAIGSARIGLVGMLGDETDPIISTNWVKIGVQSGANDGVTAEEFNSSVKAIWQMYYSDMAAASNEAKNAKEETVRARNETVTAKNDAVSAKDVAVNTVSGFEKVVENKYNELEAFTENKKAEINAEKESALESIAGEVEKAEGFAGTAEQFAENAGNSELTAVQAEENAFNYAADAKKSKEDAESAEKGAYDHREDAKHWAATAMVEAASIKNMTVAAEEGAEAKVIKTETDDGIHLEFTIPKGEKGESGHTPVKGVDYFTEEDIEALNLAKKEEIKELEESVKTNSADIKDIIALNVTQDTELAGLMNDVNNIMLISAQNSDAISAISVEKADILYVDEKIGDIEAVMDELHNYAQALIGGAE